MDDGFHQIKVQVECGHSSLPRVYLFFRRTIFISQNLVFISKFMLKSGSFLLYPQRNFSNQVPESKTCFCLRYKFRYTVCVKMVVDLFSEINFKSNLRKIATVHNLSYWPHAART